MSIFAQNFIIDEETGEPKLVKHLNQRRIDHWCLSKRPGGWNKSGKKKRINKSSEIYRNKSIERQFETQQEKYENV